MPPFVPTLVSQQTETNTDLTLNSQQTHKIRKRIKKMLSSKIEQTVSEVLQSVIAHHVS